MARVSKYHQHMHFGFECIKIKKHQGIWLKNTDFTIKVINFKKGVAYPKKMFYSNKRCDMIAMKREVAAFIQLSRFSVERMSRGQH